MQPGTQIGPYRIVGLIGEGGMGVVYEAIQHPIERRVALKLLHPKFTSDAETVRRFFNEARASSRIEHPSIVQVSDFGHAPDGAAYLVMEFLRGESLAARLRRLGSDRQRLPLGKTLQIAWQVADALAAAHEKGIIHRDLKPDNLMLIVDRAALGGERVKILDFGIAKLTHDVTGSKGATATNQVMGTPVYMSPEQCAGAGGVDTRTDVYSLGILMYEVLAGRPPFLAEGGGQIIGMHLFKEPPPLASLAPTVPTDVIALVHRLLTKEKENRPNMKEVVGELERLMAKLSGSGPAVDSISSMGSMAAGPETDLSDETQVQIRTTLGQSMGQRSLSVVPRRLRLIGALVGGIFAAIALALILRATLAQPSPPASQPIPAAPQQSGTVKSPSSNAPSSTAEVKSASPSIPPSGPDPSGARKASAMNPPRRQQPSQMSKKAPVRKGLKIEE